jgi:ssDNA-binding Zn-finger/Zn-ribbon topoisomerase 1
MALLDLDKIIIKRTIIGIRCTSCGGNLVVAKKRSIVGRFIKLVSFGTIKPKNYECENCKKRHLLL